MSRPVSYTAAYAEMSRYVDQGLKALETRNVSAALLAFERAVLLADTADLGAPVRIGVRRNLARAYRNAGRLAEAEAAYRELLQRSDLPEREAPYVLHGLGQTLAVAGRPEAEAMLAQAVAAYSRRSDILAVSLDLAEFRGEHGSVAAAYDDLARTVQPEDLSDHPDLYCQALLTLSRLKARSGDPPGARRHLEEAQGAMETVGAPGLQSLRLGTLSELARADGDDEQAGLLAVEALESALVQAELHSTNVLRKAIRLFLQMQGGRSEGALQEQD